NPDAPSLIQPGNLGTITIGDPAAYAKAARDVAAEWDGAEVFIVIVHMGATGTDAMMQPTGPLIDLAQQLHGFDFVIGDHTNQVVNTTINGALVIENKSQGQTYARIKFKYDFPGARVTDKAVEILQPMSDPVTPDPAIVNLLAPYRTELARQFDG